MHKAKELPLVSVITPAYNRASFLDETILSVLNQDYAGIEYIVLDDGSTDDTLNVIKNYEGKIRWETHENMGETLTVNKGFSMANGEIIGVVNSDDPLLPGAISAIVACMMAEPELLVVYPDWNMIDENGKTIRHIMTFDYSYIDMLRWHHCMPGPGTFFRRVVVDRLQGRDPQFRYVGDFDFWLRAGLIGPFARIPYTLATFRFHSDSASVSQTGDLMAEEHIRLVDKIYSLPDLPPEVLRVKKEAYSSAYYIAGCVCGSESSFKKRCYLLALYYSPWKYFNEYRGRLLTMRAELPGYHTLRALFMLFFRPRRSVSIVKRKLFKCQK
jgi:glycosyltransferase involved in cell wall biosynthesis